MMGLTSTPPTQSTDIDALNALWEESPDEERRVIVLIQHPNMPTASECTYGCRFPVQPGDSVLCPPAPLWKEPFVGIVVATEGSTYDGPLKYLIRKV